MAREFDLVIKALAERYPAHLVQLVRGVPVEKVERVEKRSSGRGAGIGYTAQNYGKRL
ncbi:MAG: hypothetical protein ACPLRU_08750 [Desulfofundulus sp.]